MISMKFLNFYTISDKQNIEKYSSYEVAEVKIVSVAHRKKKDYNEKDEKISNRRGAK